MQKKKAFKSKKNSHKKLIKTIGIVSIILIFILAVFILNGVAKSDFSVYDSIEGEETPQTSITQFFLSPEAKAELEEKKAEEERLNQIEELAKKEQEDQDSKTNVLILGRGGGNHDAPDLTDSIILASFHRNKNHISLLSIPRDLYVEYGDYNSSGVAYKGKINGLYVHYLAKYQNEEEAVFELKKKITEITNEKIDHYVNIDFTGFIKLVDSLGGVQIEVPKTIVDNQYPDNNLGYQTFILRKGDWLLDGKVALKYVRSRKNTGGDFGRSERQQQVIESLKGKILTGKYLSSPSNIKELYDIFTTYVSTDISAFMAAKYFSDIKGKENTTVYSSGINDTCIDVIECEKGGFLYYPQRVFFGGQSVLLPNGADSDELDYFEGLQDYSDIVFNSPKLFNQSYKISIFSKIGDKPEAILVAEQIKIMGGEINMEEKIGFIPEEKAIIENPEQSLITGSIEEGEEKLTLEEYNERKDDGNIDKNSQSVEEIVNDISQEAENTRTKVIYNNMPKDIESIDLLKKILKLEDEDIELYEQGGPKYARDPNTKIEIIFVSEEE